MISILVRVITLVSFLYVFQSYKIKSNALTKLYRMQNMELRVSLKACNDLSSNHFTTSLDSIFNRITNDIEQNSTTGITISY